MDTQGITEITNLLGRYCHLVDRGDIEQIPELFWPDSVLHFNGTHEGIDQVLASYRTWKTEARDPVENLRHMIFSPEITIDGDQATAVCYFNADCTARRSGKEILIKGRYEDRLSRRDGTWRLTERRIVIH